MLRRLDAELVHRKLARSRDHARELIESGVVQVSGITVQKPASQVREETSIRIESAQVDHYVSRGAHKLVGALDRFSSLGLTVEGRLALDAGASTGGFTQVLLERGSTSVLAVDVGYGVLAWPIRSDSRVHVYERMNVRNLRLEQLAFAPELIVADLSFISLRTVLPALTNVATADADLLLMVKPQFEVGKAAVGNGVVRDPQLRASAVASVANAMQSLGFGVRDVVASPLPGPSGNVEYFVWASRGVEWCLDLDSVIERAVSEGPQ
jgi:23S rRNA (cytidine1920-2'-O)/16S rRNA (cytidine1409-2'-O)-methyltransferase